jgi:hypothetical protein
VLVTDIMYIYIHTLYICLWNSSICYMYLSRFKTGSVFHSFGTRNKSRFVYLFISVHNTKLFEMRIAYNGVLFCNRPYEVKSVTCIIKLKKIIINFLFKKFLYPVEEFMTWSITYKNCVNGVFYSVIFCTLSPVCCIWLLFHVVLYKYAIYIL